MLFYVAQPLLLMPLIVGEPEASAESYTKPSMGKAGREVLCAINPPTKPSTPRHELFFCFPL
ncbi:hypothetical protein PMIT1318_00325 [Prochlorococcus marinus str. MIT 1318]|nr:hypothetical protein PMIT1318_00325 [Prochlorococcus marinus str. MIT 1318]